MITPTAQLELGSISHLPEVQAWIDMVQATQGTPFSPQAWIVSPFRHWPKEQHPWQLLGPQGPPPVQELVLGSQVPPLCAQFWQAAPPVPQALSALPPRHWLF